jgi:ATP-dependent RNA helicase SUPV3L1/SUV3
LFAITAFPLNGVGRGLAFQLAEALGALPARAVTSQVAALDQADRKMLSRLGVRFGTETLFVEPLLRSDPLRFRTLLWAVRHAHTVPALPGARRLARVVETDPNLPASYYAALGFFFADGLALRADRLEMLAAAARGLSRRGAFAADDRLTAIAGGGPGVLRRLLVALGYRAVIAGGVETFIARSRRRRGAAGRGPAGGPSEDHPFAKLQELKLA